MTRRASQSLFAISHFDRDAHEATVKAMKSEVLKRLKEKFGDVKMERNERWYEHAIYIVNGRKFQMGFKRWGYAGHVEVTLGWRRNYSPFILRSKTVEGLDYDKIMQGFANAVESQIAREEHEAKQDRVRKHVLGILKKHGYGEKGRCHVASNDESTAAFDVEEDGCITIDIRIHNEDLQTFLDVMEPFTEREK